MAHGRTLSPQPQELLLAHLRPDSNITATTHLVYILPSNFQNEWRETNIQWFDCLTTSPIPPLPLSNTLATTATWAHKALTPLNWTHHRIHTSNLHPLFPTIRSLQCLLSPLGEVPAPSTWCERCFLGGPPEERRCCGFRGSTYRAARSGRMTFARRDQWRERLERNPVRVRRSRNWWERRRGKGSRGAGRRRAVRDMTFDDGDRDAMSEESGDEDSVSDQSGDML